jgi:hypothetical protein
MNLRRLTKHVKDPNWFTLEALGTNSARCDSETGSL